MCRTNGYTKKKYNEKQRKVETKKGSLKAKKEKKKFTPEDHLEEVARTH